MGENTSLSAMGISQVDQICFTQHRRPNTSGAYALLAFNVSLVAPLKEKHLFETAAEEWGHPAQRWHPYHQQPGLQVLAQPLSNLMPVRIWWNDQYLGQFRHALLRV